MTVIINLRILHFCLLIVPQGESSIVYSMLASSVVVHGCLACGLVHASSLRIPGTRAVLHMVHTGT